MLLVPTNTTIPASDYRRARLLLLRVRMVPSDEPTTDLPPVPGSSAPSSVAPDVSPVELMTAAELAALPESTRLSVLADGIAPLNPQRRFIALELFWQGVLIGEWRMTALDLGLLLDPEGALAWSDQMGRLPPVIGRVASHAFRVLYRKLPRVVQQLTADEWRRVYSRTESLPLRVCEGLEQVLGDHAPDRRVLWLEIGEPIAYLPLLAWEQMLRPCVGVPVVRLPYHTVDAVCTHTTLDVLLTCSAPEVRPAVLAQYVVTLAKRIFAVLPSGRRCVIHVFADGSSHTAVRAALHAVKDLPVGTIEPADGRGVVVYDLPTLRRAALPAPNPQSLEIRPDPEDHPWARWILDALGGRAIDVTHVISSGALTSHLAALTVAAEPRLSDSTMAVNAGGAVRIRYVDAQQMCDFAARMGSWAVVLSSARPDDRRALRAVMDRMARIAPIVVASHEPEADTGAAAAESLYRNLASERIALPRTGVGDVVAPGAPLVDNPAVCLYLPPSRVFDWVPEVPDPASDEWATSNRELADAYLSAKRSIRAVMDLPDATPTWLAVSQRVLEQKVSNLLDAQPNTPEDRAAQEGVAEALKIALGSLARSADAMSLTLGPAEQMRQVDSQIPLAADEGES